MKKAKRINTSKKGLISIIVSCGVACVTALSLVLGLVVFKPKTDKPNETQTEAVSVVPVGVDKANTGGFLYVEEGATYVMKGGAIKGHDLGTGDTFGGAVFVAKGGKFVLEDGTVEGGKATYGGAIFVEKGGTCELKGGTIIGDDDLTSHATYGGGIFVDAGATLTISTSKTVVKNSKATYGGGIYVNDGASLTIDREDFEVKDCSATQNGGGIYIHTGTNTIKGTISGNSAKNGAGIFIEKGTNTIDACLTQNTATEKGGALFVNNSEAQVTVAQTSEISGNEAVLGGGIYIQNGTNIINSNMNGNTASSGGAVYTNGGTNAFNGNFEECSSTDAGGALYLNKGDNEVVGEFSECDTDGNGGGIYIGESGASVSIKPSASFWDCDANLGGGIYNHNGTMILNGEVYECNANTSGGGVYIHGGINSLGGAIHNCVADYGAGVYAYRGENIYSGSTYDNSASNSGGGVYIENELSKNTFTVDADVSGNQAKFGGGIYAQNGTNEYNCYIYGNDVYYDQEDVSEVTREDGSKVTVINAAQGAGVFLRYGINTFTGDCCIEENDTQNQGGGVYSFDGDNTLGCIISGNYSEYEGGGIYVNQGLCTISGLVMNNTATFGGGAYIAYREATAVFTDDCYVSENYADDGAGINVDHGTVTIAGYVGLNYANANGGGIFINEGTVQVDANIEANEAQFNGGGVYAGATLSEVNFTNNAVIFDNTAGIDGGGVYAKYGKNTINATIDSNYAPDGYGGGLCIYKGSNTIGADAIISSNSALFGGGIYAYDIDREEVGSSIHESASITSNEAQCAGGGLYIENGKWDINGTFSSNFVAGSDAEGFGAGIYIRLGSHTLAGTVEECEVKNCERDTYGGGVVIIDASVTFGTFAIDNCYAENGGGLYLGAGYDKKITGSPTITGCSAVNGGGLYLSSGVEAEVKDATLNIQSCQATNGGGVYVSPSAKYLKAQVSLSSNSATNGGGIGIDGGVVNLTGVISQNIARNGAGMLISGKPIALPSNLSISNNVAEVLGGGVYAKNGATVTAQNVVINENLVTGKSTSVNVKGGGIYIEGEGSKIKGTLKMTGNGFSGSAKYCYGGAIYVASGAQAELNSGVMTGNKATATTYSGGYGGTVYVEETSTLAVSGTTFNGVGSTKCADYGGAIFNEGRLKFNSGNITNYTTQSATQGSCIAGYGEMVLDGGVIAASSTSSSGSAIIACADIKIGTGVTITGLVSLGANAYTLNPSAGQYLAQAIVKGIKASSLRCSLVGVTINKTNKTFEINTNNTHMRAVYERGYNVTGVAKQSLFLEARSLWEKIRVDGGYVYYSPDGTGLGVYKGTACKVVVKTESGTAETIPVLSGANNVSVVSNADGSASVTVKTNMFTGAQYSKKISTNSGAISVSVDGADLAMGATKSLSLTSTSTGVTTTKSEVLTKTVATQEAPKSDFIFEDAECTKLIGYTGTSNNVTLPSTTVVICTEAFRGNTKITSILIPDSVTTIEESAFEGCAALQAVYSIGQSTTRTFNTTCKLTTIGSFAFYNCSALTSFDFSKLMYLSTIGTSGFENSKITTFSVPALSPISSIGGSAFARCKSLTTVTLTNASKLTVLESNMFGDCSALKTVNLGSALQTIKYTVFYNCTALKSLTIPYSVTAIYRDMLSGCTSLETLSVGNGVVSVKTVGSDRGTTNVGFSNLDVESFRQSLKTLTLGTGITVIPSRKFEKFTKLATVNFKGTEINDLAFFGCSSLSSFSGVNVETIGQGAFMLTPNSDNPDDVTDCAVSFTFNRLKSIDIWAFAYRKSFTGFTFPSTLTTINDQAFACSGITSVNLSYVTSLGQGAFAACSNLKTVTIGSKLTKIPSLAFAGTGITKISIPSTIQSIAVLAFQNCTALTAVRIDSGVPVPEIKICVTKEQDSMLWQKVGVAAGASLTIVGILSLGDGVLPFGEIAGGIILAGVSIGAAVETIWSEYRHYSAFSGCTNARIYTDNVYIGTNDWRMYDIEAGKVGTCPKGPYSCYNGCVGTPFLGICCCESCPTH